MLGRLRKRDPELYVAVELLIWGEVMTPEQMQVVERAARNRLVDWRLRQRAASRGILRIRPS